MALHYLAIAAALALLLWLVVPRAVDQVDQALGAFLTSQLELNQKAKHSSGIKHEVFVGLQKRLPKLPSAGRVVHGAVPVGTKAFEALIGVFFVSRPRPTGSSNATDDRSRDSMMARPHRKTVRDTWELIDLKLGAFVRGQGLMVAFVATVLSLSFWAIGMPYWLLVGVFAGIVEIVPVIGPILAGAFAVGIGLTDSSHVASRPGSSSWSSASRGLRGHPARPRGPYRAVAAPGARLCLGHRPSARRLLRGARDPVVAVLMTLFDVVVRDKDPAQEDVPTVLFREGGLGLAPAAKDRPPRVTPRPKVPSAKPPIATPCASVERPCQRPIASSSSLVSCSPRRRLRIAPPARTPR